MNINYEIKEDISKISPKDKINQELKLEQERQQLIK